MFERLLGFDTDLFDRFAQMQRELDELFGRALPTAAIRGVPAGTFPAVNLGETDNDVRVYVFAPGIDPEKLDVTMEGNVLAIEGERQESVPDNATVYRNERFQGRFRRVLALPEAVDEEQVNATYKDGVLQVVVGKKAEAQPRKIEVKAD
ncbi:MAG TPA: Hsp20/alpha crystallin family protein [Chromatiales bacterium]|nr:Hsp20/alpha crystallin family protein [Chromatiales bacterium]